MDAHSRSLIEPDPVSTDSFSAVFPEPAETPSDFPVDLCSASEASLIQLCDALFLELDSETPDFRAMERYQSVCDELALRRASSGVA